MLGSKAAESLVVIKFRISGSLGNKTFCLHVMMKENE